MCLLFRHAHPPAVLHDEEVDSALLLFGSMTVAI
jgi:hypothetical protein